MSSPDQLHIQPPDQWYAERGDRIELHDAFDGTPLRGHDYNRDADRPPTQFDFNVDWHDGYMEWRRAKEQTGDSLNISVLLTDPARPDGLGSTEFMRYALGGEFDMIGYAATRSVYHSVRQHGVLPNFLGQMPRGSRLGEPAPNSDYQDQLDELLLQAGVPAFCYDPAFGPNEPAQKLVEGVQALRAVAYVEGSKQENMRDPDFAFFVPDFVHTSSLQWLQFGIAGLRMREMVDEQSYGELPERLLLIAPLDQSALIYKLGVTTGITEINADVALKEMAAPSYMDDQYMSAYAKVLQDGYIPLG